MQKSHRKFAGFKKTPYLCTRLTAKRSGFSAVGSAHVWGARGRWFESSNPDQNKKGPRNANLFFVHFYFQNGPWPMHEVVPRAVNAAVRIDTMT